MSLWRLFNSFLNMGTLGHMNPAEQIVAEQDGVIWGGVFLYPAGTIFSTPEGVPISLAWPEVRLLAVELAARGQSIGAAPAEGLVHLGPPSLWVIFYGQK